MAARSRSAHPEASTRCQRAGGLPALSPRRGAVPRYEAHTVYHRQAADWLDAYERELASFPTAAHDDQVDCYIYAALTLPKRSPTTARRHPPQKTVFGGLLDRTF